MSAARLHMTMRFWAAIAVATTSLSGCSKFLSFLGSRSLGLTSSQLQPADTTPDCGGTNPYPCPTNWKTGISVGFQGKAGRDYAEEYFFHDKLLDDHKVVFIKSSVPITMKHNERNSLSTNLGYSDLILGTPGGAEGFQGLSGDAGVIRYRLDRDLQLKFNWAGANTFPAYAGPFRFADLTYQIDGNAADAVPVVGTTGPNSAPITDRVNYYHRGILDSFGDEWHSLGVGDDDSFRNDYYIEKWSSDGKTILFVVNPKTPAIDFTPTTATAQFYTTPPKPYYLPRVYNSTTYLTSNVSIRLTNVTDGNPVHYRINGGPDTVYTAGNLTSNDPLFHDGPNQLEYWFDPAHHRIRPIVRNPGYPSDADQFVDGTKHGYLLWRNDAELAQIKARIHGGNALMTSMYGNPVAADQGDWSGADQLFRKGLRKTMEGFLGWASAVAFEGADKVPNTAKHAKMALMETQLNIDRQGHELPCGQTPLPSKELCYHGYYAVNPVFEAAFSYDLLIKYYRSSQYPGGITPIEDYFIRDLLAAEVLEQMQGFAGPPNAGGDAQGRTGMWDTARQMGAAVAAMAMPSYDTEYYGTSGFDGRQATHAWTPYRDVPESWKDVFFTYTNENDPASTSRLTYYPNRAWLFNQIQGHLIAANGDWWDRVGYFDYPLMGHVFQIFANAAKIRMNVDYADLLVALQRANAGTLTGLKINSPEDQLPMRYQEILMINSRFPTLAQQASDNIALNCFPNNDGSPRLFDFYAGYLAGTYGITFFDPTSVTQRSAPLPACGYVYP